MSYFTQAEEALTQGSFTMALNLFLYALEQEESLVDSRGGKPEILRKAARCAFLLENKPRSIELARQALYSSKDQSNKKEEAEAHLLLGILYGDVNAWELSIDHSRNAYQILKSSEPLRAASALNNTGNVYEAMKHSDRAIEYFRSALLVYESEGKTDRNLGIIYGNLGKLLGESGNTESGIEYLKKSIKVFRELNDSSYQAHTLAKIAKLHESRGEYNTAEVLYREALQLLEDSPHPLWEIEIKNQLARFLVTDGQFTEAKTILNQIKKTISSEEPNHNHTYYYETQSLFHETQNDYKAALEAYKRGYNIEIQMQKQQSSNNLAKALALLDIERVKLETEVYRLKNLELQRQVIRDPLTGLYNRRYIMEQLPTEIARLKRSGEKMGFAFVDVNSFKEINDVHSHLVGDKVLIQLALLFRDTLRDSDTIIRYGGDEFIIFMPGLEEADVEPMRKKIERTITEYTWENIAPELEVSLSVGIVLGQENLSMEEILHQADSRMYQRKNQ